MPLYYFNGTIKIGEYGYQDFNNAKIDANSLKQARYKMALKLHKIIYKGIPLSILYGYLNKINVTTSKYSKPSFK